MTSPETTIPYGCCHCGCGQKTKLAKRTSTPEQLRLGEPKRFVNGHNGRASRNPLKHFPNPDNIPYGDCYCGCGEKTTICSETSFRKGAVRGEPRHFIRNHRKFTPNKVSFGTHCGDDVAFIHLAGQEDRVAIVDICDLPLLVTYRWRWGSKGYVVATPPKSSSTIQMHKLLLTVPSGFEVDHENHLPHDNRRKNLRQATRFQQEQNKQRSRANTSGFKGVHWSKVSKKWLVMITFSGCTLRLGYFDDKVLAAKTYDVAARKHHGEFAVLNFPDES